MIITRCTAQTQETLDEFYSDSCDEEGPAMLALLSALRSNGDDWKVWGLTSHSQLCFLAGDSWDSPWFLILTALNLNHYRIEYRLPDEVAPWPEAYVSGEAKSVEEAVDKILIAMVRSGGWSLVDG